MEGRAGGHRAAGAGERRTAKPGALCGTVVSLADSVFDYPYGADVVLTGAADSAPSTPITRQTTSTVRGGYRFDSVPAGKYSITAYSPNQANANISAGVDNVRVDGGLTTPMVNLILGTPAGMATFTGTVTRGGNPAAGVTVSLETAAYDINHIVDPTDTTPIVVIVNTVTDASGIYTFHIPSGAIGYILSTDSSSTDHVESGRILDLAAGEVRTINLALPAATSVIFPELDDFRLISTTLPEASTKAAADAMVTRMAVAQANNASAAQLDRLRQMATSRALTRGVPGIMENDLDWNIYYTPQWYVDNSPLDFDPSLRGYYIYRSATVGGPFAYIGASPNPYEYYFFDLDPALTTDPAYYVVTSFAAGGAVSGPSKVIPSHPMPQLQVTGPDDGASVASSDAQVSWQAVTGAKSYMVLLFNALPSYNSLPTDTKVIAATETSASFAGLAPGTYWWGVSAYNDETPYNADAACYSEYRQVVVTP